MKTEKKVLEFEITEEEFDKYVTQQGLALLATEEDYMLYGTALGADIKYKNYKKDDNTDGFRIVQFAPQEVTCGKCHIKIHTGYHDECPVCKTALADMVQKNREYNDRMHDFQTALNEKFQNEYREFNSNLIEEYGFNF